MYHRRIRVRVEESIPFFQLSHRLVKKSTIAEYFQFRPFHFYFYHVLKFAL